MRHRHQEDGQNEAVAHEQQPGKCEEAVSQIVKLRKMVDHWISHNEEHARSYRLWANRARKAGCEEPGEILEEIALDIVKQNERLRRIADIIDLVHRPN